jgi:hypothetical protein
LLFSRFALRSASIIAAAVLFGLFEVFFSLGFLIWRVADPWLSTSKMACPLNVHNLGPNATNPQSTLRPICIPHRSTRSSEAGKAALCIARELHSF